MGVTLAGRFLSLQLNTATSAAWNAASVPPSQLSVIDIPLQALYFFYTENKEIDLFNIQSFAT